MNYSVLIHETTLTFMPFDNLWVSFSYFSINEIQVTKTKMIQQYKYE